VEEGELVIMEKKQLYCVKVRIKGARPNVFPSYLVGSRGRNQPYGVSRREAYYIKKKLAGVYSRAKITVEKTEAKGLKELEER
jgi:hypothetical protein